MKEAAKRDKEEQLRLRKESTQTTKATKSRIKVVNRPIPTAEVEEVEEVVVTTSKGR